MSGFLKIISDDMASLGLNYEFLEYHVAAGEKTPITYFTGEYQETPSVNEDGEQETTFILNGFTRGKFIELENAKNKIKACYPKSSGKVVTTDSGSVVAIFYANALPIPTGNAEFKRIQINLTVKEWSAEE